MNAPFKAKNLVQRPPKHLKEAGKRLWNQVVQTFVLEEHQLTLLQAACEALDRKTQAENDLRKHRSLTFTNRHGELKPHPAVAIVRDCNLLIARLTRELNLSEEAPEPPRPPGLKYGRKR
jgi:P27 family predicted phage terminase small subunit